MSNQWKHLGAEPLYIGVVHKVPQRGTRPWVLSFFKKTSYIRSLWAHRVSEPTLKFLGLLFSPIELWENYRIQNRVCAKFGTTQFFTIVFFLDFFKIPNQLRSNKLRFYSILLQVSWDYRAEGPMSTNGGANCLVPSAGIKPWLYSQGSVFFALAYQTAFQRPLSTYGFMQFSERILKFIVCVNTT